MTQIKQKYVKFSLLYSECAINFPENKMFKQKGRTQKWKSLFFLRCKPKNTHFRLIYTQNKLCVPL